MKNIKTAALIAFSFFSLSTQAAQVTLQSTWKVNSAVVGGVSRIGNLVFTYDDQTLDSNPSADIGTYSNLITSATFAFENYVYTLDNSKSNGVGINAVKNVGTNISIHFWTLDQNAQAVEVTLALETNKVLGSDSLSHLIGAKCNDACLTALQTPTTYLLNQETAMTPVPVPAAAWLFGSGLLGLAGAVRRKSKTA